MFFDNVNVLALFLYNESVMISSLTYNVFIFTLNIKSVVLKIGLCSGMTPISVS